MKNGLWILILAAAAGMLLVSCARFQRAPGSTVVTAAPGQGTGGITKLHFNYDRFSGEQLELDVWMKDISASGSTAQVKKRVGPMNYTGTTREGNFTVSSRQLRQLLEILEEYDLRAWSQLPRRGHGSSPTRHLTVWYGEEMVDVPWDAIFPETLPPREEIMYARIYNYFNGLIREDPDWKDVDSPDLEDPRDNPAYSERTVTQYGHEVRLVPGTGVYSKEGQGAKIDYGEKKWWLEEGFTGHWVMTDADLYENAGYRIQIQADLTVLEDGTFTLVLDGVPCPGVLAEDRYYRSAIGARVEYQNGERSCEIWPTEEGSYRKILLRSYPGPVPEPQYTPIDVYLTKQD